MGDIHLSTGMTTRSEINEIIEFYKSKNRIDDVVLYSCTSGYPVDFEDVCLREITNLVEILKGTGAKVGFSGHHLGIAVDVAAVTLGAVYVERHFTLDRTWRGTDHAASLEPPGLSKVCRDIKNIEKALAYKSKDLLDVEVEQREKN